MIRKPEFVTFTGLDDWTDLDEVARISAKYPVEWGVLFSATQQGRSHRFPGLSRLAEIQSARGLRLAAHLCGEHVKKIIAGQVPDVPAVLTDVYARVQINHVYAQPQKIAAFQAMCGVPCIGQFVVGPFPGNDSIQWLYDPSGGFGRAPSVWPRHPGGDRLVGYAGGIGPENVAAVIEQIGSAGPYWIDMETRIRTEEELDLDKCRRVLLAVYG